MKAVDERILTQHLGKGGKLIVAYSGGVDSHVLLHHFASSLPESFRSSLQAIHVHHGLSPNADAWLAHCQQQCEALSIPLHVEYVHVSLRGSIEENARNARYQAFAKHMRVGDILLQGHHANDQAETLLFRLERGAGTRGIQGIPTLRPLAEGVLWRPLLMVSRQEIEHYALKHKLVWVEDESNNELTYQRNVLRHNVLQPWQAHNPDIARAMASSAALIQKEMTVLDRLAEEALQAYQNSVGGLVIERVPSSELEFWLSRFLRSNSVSLTESQLLAAAKMFTSSAEKQPIYRGSTFQLVRYAEVLYVLPLTESPTVIDLKADEWLSRPYDRLYSDHLLTIRPRPQGAILKLPNGRHRPLKKWLQDQRIPAWWREQLPYLFEGEVLVAVADLWVNPDWSGKVIWQPSGKLPWPEA